MTPMVSKTLSIWGVFITIAMPYYFSTFQPMYRAEKVWLPPAIAVESGCLFYLIIDFGEVVFTLTELQKHFHSNAIGTEEKKQLSQIYVFFKRGSSSFQGIAFGNKLKSIHLISVLWNFKSSEMLSNIQPVGIILHFTIVSFIRRFKSLLLGKKKKSIHQTRSTQRITVDQEGNYFNKIFWSIMVPSGASYLHALCTPSCSLYE